MSVKAEFAILKVLVSGDACQVFLEEKSIFYSQFLDRSLHFLPVSSFHCNLEDVCRKENEASV